MRLLRMLEAVFSVVMGADEVENFGFRWYWRPAFITDTPRGILGTMYLMVAKRKQRWLAGWLAMVIGAWVLAVVTGGHNGLPLVGYQHFVINGDAIKKHRQRITGTKSSVNNFTSARKYQLSTFNQNMQHFLAQSQTFNVSGHIINMNLR